MSSLNQNFLGQVKNIANHLSELNVSSVKSSNVNATNVTHAMGGVALSTVVGYAPAGFSTLGAGSALTLVDVPGGYSPTGAGDSHLVALPANAAIVRGTIDNKGVAVDVNVDLGVGAFNNSTLSPTLLTSMNLTTAAPYTILALEPPIPPVLVPLVPAVAGQNYLNVLNSTAGALSTGDLRVVLELASVNVS